MKPEDIIRMAREAGIQGMCTDVICTWSELTKFAQLVAEAERESCAKVAEPHWRIAAAIRARGQADTNTKGTHE